MPDRRSATNPSTAAARPARSGRGRFTFGAGGEPATAYGAIAAGAGRAVIVCDVDGLFGLIEFPTGDPDRARRFWSGLLGIELVERSEVEGRGWQSHSGSSVLGIHERGAGPGDTASLPHFPVAEMEATLEKVAGLGGSVIHPGA